MMRKTTLTGIIFLFILGFASPLWAQSGASVQYVYDALGRLTTVVDPSGNVATYNYDAVGNLLSITRSTSSPSALAIFGFNPSQGSIGQTVVIQGINVAAEIGLHSAVAAAPHVVIGTFTSVSTPVSYIAGVYNPITVAETSASLGGEFVAGELLELFSGGLELKLAYDAEIYVLSYGVCLYTN